MTKNLYMKKMGEKAKNASLNLSNLSIDKKNSVLKQFSHYLKINEQLILNENKKDIVNAKSKKIKGSMIDRLELNSKKITQIRSAIKKIIKFKDPVGKTLSFWKRPNGLIIKKVNGKFNKGDHIKILDINMIEYARGLSSFTSDEISKIKGQHSGKIRELLGYVAKSEVVHKDDMVEV